MMRDGYGFLESEQAPELFLQDISLSFAVTMLLDSIGFSNYKFLRLPGENETIIPFFFVATGRSVADVLKDLAIATQTSMWFDEKNDFCVASKNWALPSGDERPADGVLAGDSLYTEAGALTSLANIINISSDEKKVANDGKVNYTRTIPTERESKPRAVNAHQQVGKLGLQTFNAMGSSSRRKPEGLQYYSKLLESLTTWLLFLWSQTYQTILLM